jgi:ParB-like nuclease domain
MHPDDLDLDATNPRLAGDNLKSSDEVEIIKVLWREKAVAELVESISENGYWKHEEIFATKERGRFVVIEGNRRLAAIKLLLHPELSAKAGIKNIPTITSKVKESITQLPVIECSRFDVWQYLGFKHVNGPQDWDSIAKAEYVARIHNEYGIPLDEIARTIGDRNNTVKRLYRGLMVLKQAEDTAVFDRDNIYGSRFAYSHLWTGLNFPNTQAFIGLDPDKSLQPNPVPKRKLEELGELCLWLYGNKERGEAPLIRSQNPDLRKLDAVLGSPNGIAALRNKFPLDSALNASRGDKRLLREALVAGEKALRDCRGYVVNGYEGESDLVDMAESIQSLAIKLYAEMVEYEPPSKSSSKRRARK